MANYPFTDGEQVEVLWNGRWYRATIERCWSDGANVVVDPLGAMYFQWHHIRAVS